MAIQKKNPEPDSEYQAFSNQVLSVIDSIVESLRESPEPSVMPRPVSGQWRDTQEQLRTVAGDLMVCADVKATLLKLKEGILRLRILSLLIVEMPRETFQKVLQSAYASRPLLSPILPGQSFATFLLALANLSAEEVRQAFDNSYECD